MHAELPERVEFAADFRVGDWLVEPSLDRVSRNGTVLRLRPQLIDLLVLLARHAGRTVSKEMILTEVWQGQHVAESGLTRCVAEIRQALQDDAHEPTMVQTIPKRGYRLVAPVELLGTPASAAPAVPEPEAATPPGPAPRIPRAVGWTLGSAAGVVLLVTVFWAAGAWSRAPVLSDRDTVLLADVTNSTGDSAFDGTLRLALAVHLGQAPFLHILSDDHMRTALSRTGKPASQPVVGVVALEVCRREGAAVLLAGSIARLGSHYAVGIEAIACRTGESIARELVEVDGKERVLTELGTAAARLRQKLGESRSSLQQYDVPIVQATTPSLEALRALSLGDVNRDHARLGEALTLYRRATDLDPQFALAWARRGAAARNLGQPEESVPAFRKAYDLRDRVSEPERYYIQGHYYRFVADDPDKAVDTYRMWQRTYPGSAIPPTNLASLYVNTFGQYDAGLAPAREAVRLAPYSSVALRMLVGACLGTNRLPEAREAMRAAAHRGVADVVWHGLAFQIAMTDGDTAAMQEHVRWAAGTPSALAVMAPYQALAAASLGRLREARRLWSEAAAAAAQGTSLARQAGIRLVEGEAEALLGDPARARLAAEAALAVDRQPRTMLSAAIVFALAGNAARADALVNDAVRRAEPGICARPVWLPVARALADAGLGRPGQARAALGEAARFERGREYGLTPLGVRGLIELTTGRPKEAASTFQAVIGLRVVVPTSPWIAFARLGLARALRDAGDLPGSRAAYDVVLAAMTGADADAPLAAAARAERAALASR